MKAGWHWRCLKACPRCSNLCINSISVWLHPMKMWSSAFSASLLDVCLCQVSLDTACLDQALSFPLLAQMFFCTAPDLPWGLLLLPSGWLNGYPRSTKLANCFCAAAWAPSAVLEFQSTAAQACAEVLAFPFGFCCLLLVGDDFCHCFTSLWAFGVCCDSY